MADAGGDGALAGGRGVLVLRADLEQRRIAQTTRLVALGGVDQVGQDRGPHRIEFGRDRVQQAQVSRSAAETLGDMTAYSAVLADVLADFQAYRSRRRGRRKKS